MTATAKIMKTEKGHVKLATGYSRYATRVTYADGTTQVFIRTDGVDRCGGGRRDTSSKRKATPKQAETFVAHTN